MTFLSSMFTNKKNLEWEESSVQQEYYEQFSEPGSLIIPNTSLLGWEADLFHVDLRGFAHEIEIKRGRSDFRNDVSKIEIKIDDLSIPEKGQSKYEQWQEGKGPNLFSYLCPNGLISSAEVPEFAGLMYWDSLEEKDGIHLRFSMVRQPRLLHDRSLTNEHFQQLLKSIVSRLWTHKALGKQLSETKLTEAIRSRNRLKRQLQAEKDANGFVRKISELKQAQTQEKLDSAVFLLQSIVSKQNFDTEIQKLIQQFLSDVNDY